MKTELDVFINRRRGDDCDDCDVFVTGVDAFLRVWILKHFLDFGQFRYFPLHLDDAAKYLTQRELDDFRPSYDEMRRKTDIGWAWKDVAKIVAPITPTRFNARFRPSEIVTLINRANDNRFPTEPTRLINEIAAVAREKLRDYIDFSTSTVICDDYFRH